jgi:hypothetical protein
VQKTASQIGGMVLQKLAGKLPTKEGLSAFWKGQPEGRVHG